MLQLTHARFNSKLQRCAEIKHIPLSVLFELTYKCNFNCAHCYIPREIKRRELNTKEVFSILEQLKDLGCLHFSFTGGEIYLRKDIAPVLWQAKRMGFNLTILTNASLIDKKQADELAKIAPLKVDITLHSLNPVHFENITRLRGSFKKVMKAIDLLHERNIPLGIKNCILRENMADFKEVEEFAEQIGASSRIGGKVFASGKNSCQPNADDLEFLAQNLPLKFKKRKAFMCATGKTAMTISPVARLKLCPHIDYPNIKIFPQGLKQAWFKLNSTVERIENEADLKCNICRLKGHCNWCPAESWTRYNNLTHCDRFN